MFEAIRPFQRREMIMKRQSSHRALWDFSLYAFEFYRMHSNTAHRSPFFGVTSRDKSRCQLVIACGPFYVGGGAVDYSRNASWET